MGKVEFVYTGSWSIGLDLIGELGVGILKALFPVWNTFHDVMRSFVV